MRHASRPPVSFASPHVACNAAGQGGSGTGPHPWAQVSLLGKPGPSTLTQVLLTQRKPEGGGVFAHHPHGVPSLPLVSAVVGHQRVPSALVAHAIVQGSPTVAPALVQVFPQVGAYGGQRLPSTGTAMIFSVAMVTDAIVTTNESSAAPGLPRIVARLQPTRCANSA
jgi:hypothetical protein